MSQQINLFNPIFLKQKKYFSALTMVQGLSLILVGCLLIVAYADVQLKIRTDEAATTAAQLLKTRDQLISITAQTAPHPVNAALEASIRKAESDIKAMQEVFDSLQSGDFGDTKGYSEYFRAFSRQIVDGLWLTGATVEGAGHEINLDGRALRPELVPVFLARLRNESKMQGRAFAALEMKVPKIEAPAGPGSGPAPPPTPAPYVEFNLQASAATDATAVPGAKGK